MFALRDYQKRAIGKLRVSYASGHRPPLMVMPTAAGTVVFSEAARLATARNTSTLIAVHRRELVCQASNKLNDAGVPHGIIAAGTKPTIEAYRIAHGYKPGWAWHVELSWAALA